MKFLFQLIIWITLLTFSNTYRFAQFKIFWFIFFKAYGRKGKIICIIQAKILFYLTLYFSTNMFLLLLFHPYFLIAGTEWIKVVEFIKSLLYVKRASLVAQMVKNLPAMLEAWVRSLDWEDPLEVGLATHSNILGWRIPMDRRAWQAIQSTGKQRVGHDWVTKHSTAYDKNHTIMWYIALNLTILNLSQISSQ